MPTRTVSISNPSGLHARPAVRFVEEAQRFSADVWIRNLSANGEFVDAKSVMRLLTADLSCGDEAEIEAEGDDAEEALDALVALIESL